MYGSSVRVVHCTGQWTRGLTVPYDCTVHGGTGGRDRGSTVLGPLYRMNCAGGWNGGSTDLSLCTLLDRPGSWTDRPAVLYSGPAYGGRGSLSAGPWSCSSYSFLPSSLPLLPPPPSSSPSPFPNHHHHKHKHKKVKLKNVQTKTKQQ